MTAQQRAAWDGMQVSFRFSARPYRWREIITTVGILYGVIVGIPVLAGLWAAWRIWLQVRG